MKFNMIVGSEMRLVPVKDEEGTTSTLMRRVPVVFTIDVSPFELDKQTHHYRRRSPKEMFTVAKQLGQGASVYPMEQVA